MLIQNLASSEHMQTEYGFHFKLHSVLLSKISTVSANPLKKKSVILPISVKTISWPFCLNQLSREIAWIWKWNYIP